jgi:glucose-6-phosphate dehydrogenase assembly protein OpcA
MASAVTAVSVAPVTINLIAFVEDPATVSRIRDRFATFAQKHACKAIVLDATRPASEQSEEMVRCVAGLQPDELRSAVHDLLISGIGSALFWAGRDLSDPRFEALASLGSIVIVDSSRAADGKASICKLAEINSDADRYVRDLSYMRLLPWQDMIAQFFDDAELARELPAIARVELASGSEPEAYYFAGWLASRLRWKPCGQNELCNEAGDTIAVGIERRGDPRRVLSVVLQSNSSRFSAELDRDSADLVCLTVSGRAPRDRRCAPLHDVDLVSLVEQAMFVPHRDAVFGEALQMARAIIDSAG